MEITKISETQEATNLGLIGKATAKLTLSNEERLERYDSCLETSRDFPEYKICVGGLTG